MNEVHVFDGSALIALFRGNDEAFRLWRECDDRITQVVLPAAAVADANTYLQAGMNAWNAILYSPVTCVDLSVAIAIDTGSMPGDLGTRHVVHEVRATRGVVVTAEPDRYRPWTLPLLVL